MHSFTLFWKWLAHLTIRPLWPCILTKFSTIYLFWSCLIYDLYVMIYICPGTIFWWEFNGGVYFHTRLTNFGNFPIYHMCIAQLIDRYVIDIDKLVIMTGLSFLLGVIHNDCMTIVLVLLTGNVAKGGSEDSSISIPRCGMDTTQVACPFSWHIR